MKRNVDAAAAALLDGLSVPAFLCRPDAGVVAANGPAGALLATYVSAPFDRPAGELLGCLNARDAGCGHGPRCADCPVRGAIRRAAAGEKVLRVPVAMVLVRDGTPHRVELRVSAEPYRPALEKGTVAGAEEDDAAPLALLTLEPAEWVK